MVRCERLQVFASDNRVSEYAFGIPQRRVTERSPPLLSAMSGFGGRCNLLSTWQRASRDGLHTVIGVACGIILEDSYKLVSAKDSLNLTKHFQRRSRG